MAKRFFNSLITAASISVGILGCSSSHHINTKAPLVTPLKGDQSSQYDEVYGDQSSNVANLCQDSATAFNCVNVVDVYDGDTIFIDIPGNHPLFGKRMGVRILGIDTPEIRSKNACEKKKGLEAKSVLSGILTNARRVDVINIRKDKYFRILGDVLADGYRVSDELIRHQLAYPYHGEKKVQRNWCVP